MVKAIKSLYRIVHCNKGTKYLCVITREYFFGFTVEPENDEVEVAEGPFLGAVCG